LKLVMKVLDIHEDNLQTSTFLTQIAMADAITPLEVIAALNRNKISFVLVGLHGLGGWMHEPRATQDVDVIVAARHHKKDVRILMEEFPNLEAVEHPVVTRLHYKDSQKIAIDVMRPSQQLFRDAFKHTHRVRAGRQEYRIPCLEMAIAMKFAPMISLHRRDKDKYQDAHDFILMVESNPDLDERKLADLGELVYQGGGAEILEMVRRVRAGEKLNL
jgi:hypothetical protein